MKTFICCCLAALALGVTAQSDTHTTDTFITPSQPHDTTPPTLPTTPTSPHVNHSSPVSTIAPEHHDTTVTPHNSTTLHPHSDTTHAQTPNSTHVHEGTTLKPVETTTHKVETSTSRYHSNFRNPTCNFTACVEPKCQCLDDKPPKGLFAENIPQFVTITFDGAVTVTNFPFYKDLFTLTNPNKCPVTATYFVSHVDTNYKLVHELHRRGNEIGAHSISKSKNNWQDYWKTLSYEKWVDEFGGQKKILSKYAAIPLEDVKGARAPNLQTAGNLTIAALVHEKFEYDCSSPSRMGIKTPFFPYTFDYGGQRGNDCPVQPCLTDEQVFPGFWEVPMNDLNVVYTVKGVKTERECATAAGCLLFNDDGTVNYTPTEDQIFNLFMENFNRFYNGNRAPFPLYLSEDWIKQEGHRKGLFKFIKEVQANHTDVYFVALEEVISWMKSGSTAAEYKTTHSKCKELKTTACAMTDLNTADLDLQFNNQCGYEKVGELDGQTKKFVICDGVACPAHYPWVGRPEA